MKVMCRMMWEAMQVIAVVMMMMAVARVGCNVGEGGSDGGDGHDGGNDGANNGASGIDRSVQDIMRNLVTPKSADSYASNNANFIIWLLNSHSELFVDDIFVADFNSFETIPKKKRRIKSFLLQMNHSNVCPFDLSCIDFKIFSEYLALKKTQCHTKNGSITNCSNTLSKSTWDACHNELMHLCHVCNVYMNEKFAKQLSVFMGMIKRMVRICKYYNLVYYFL